MSRAAQTRAVAVSCAVITLFVAGCDSGPTAPLRECFAAAGSLDGTEIPVGRGTPWEEMSDEELTRAIRERAVDNKVAVGFKAADRSRGVTRDGTVIVSDEVVGRMTVWLQDLDVNIVRSFSLIPVVVGKMEPTVPLVCTIRHHPNVDYLEPVIEGERAGLTGRR